MKAIWVEIVQTATVTWIKTLLIVKNTYPVVEGIDMDRIVSPFAVTYILLFLYFFLIFLFLLQKRCMKETNTRNETKFFKS